ncbi:MAG TPA: 2-C-methyl-D-erythritol 4-phosphate cytidylyltransferase [Acidimicrobiales bacterium]|nr:2-C-methyl-D-erythritol 4-phosphate cytidylyltransferase [Acidimicrobiales bacterium]
MAGGTGSRFGGQKQFELLEGRPVVTWSIAAARTVSDGIVVVVPDGSADSPAADDGGADRVVCGGPTRSHSVRAGLAAVPTEASVIIVHDAARPLASASLFASVVDALGEDGVHGAIPVLPVTDTLKRTSGGEVAATVDREGMVSVQTPQAFVAATLRAAHAEGGEATDDAGLLEALGATVRTVPGEPNNVKLTHPGDLAIAQAFVRRDRGAR